jgi:ribonuclease H2 subunit A
MSASDASEPGTPVPDAAGQRLFVPPSVDTAAIVAGDSYSYYSPVPAALLPPAAAAEAGAGAGAAPPLDTTTTTTAEAAGTDAGAAGNDTTTATTATTTTTTPPAPPSDTPLGPPCALGVDEAGRGPVLGPMVYGVFYLPLPLSDPLLRQTHRFDDSKALTPAVREALVQALCEPGSDLAASCGYAVRALSARDISAGMLRPAPATYNLNAQAVDATVELIRGVIARGVNVAEIYVDTVGPPAAYEARLQRLFPAARVTVAKKADSLYPCVSAASVCAKVTRDKALEALYRAHKGLPADDPLAGGMEWGSGYPSDAKCVAWLRANMHPIWGWGAAECRFSWGTARDMLEGRGCPRVEWPEGGGAGDDEAATLAAYFANMAADKSPAGVAARERDEMANWFGTPTVL